MYIYKLICRITKRVYVGLSENEPVISELKVPEHVQRDIKEFGEGGFKLIKIGYLNNIEKAMSKANYLMDLADSLYNTEYFDKDQDEIYEMEDYEIVEMFPTYPINRE